VAPFLCAPLKRRRKKANCFSWREANVRLQGSGKASPIPFPLRKKKKRLYIFYAPGIIPSSGRREEGEKGRVVLSIRGEGEGKKGPSYVEAREIYSS